MANTLALDETLGLNHFPLELYPAYGRVYFNVDAALSDWEAGLDWKIWNGPYCSNLDVDAIKEMGYTSVSLLWDIKGYRFAIIKL